MWVKSKELYKQEMLSENLVGMDGDSKGYKQIEEEFRESDEFFRTIYE